jgi:lycopene beta-cyclase
MTCRTWWESMAFQRFTDGQKPVGKLWDIVILGGGLGGLSLAVELSAPEFSGVSVLVLEKRERYVRDRTWSYWTDHVHRYSHLERHQWNQWIVSSGDVTHHSASTDWRYASLDADAFYNAALDVICASSNVVLQTNTDVDKVETIDQLDSIVTLHSGEALQARLVLDARSKPLKEPQGLVQQFVGWEVQTERDIFNTEAVQLMAFEPNANGVHFFYVLPYSARCALVESTWISPAAWQPDFETELRQYLIDIAGPDGYAVSYREHGVLALQGAQGTQGISFNQTAPLGLGRGGGTLRAATGYAFIDTVTHADHLAKSLLEALRTGTQKNWLPVAFHRNAVDSWMDDVFLSVLEQDWPRAPGYFMQLFGSVGPDDTVAFLTGRSTWVQRLRIMRALPVTPFARAAMLRHVL